MSKPKLFLGSTGEAFALDDSEEIAMVRNYLNVGDRAGGYTGAIDRHGAITYRSDAGGDRWCRTYPADHPEKPAVTTTEPAL